ncbi:MAG: FAD-dependent monooxygenase [Bacteroidales bacterium]|nr:FAD-dependent monooxygenase [Bacteroidales bacterium]
MGPFSDKTEVLIVGAGPVGLMMACQLANHGISFSHN